MPFITLQRQALQKAAAIKISQRWKQHFETREERQILRAHRQWLALSSEDKQKQDEKFQAAAWKIVYFLQDIQTGHRFVRAVQTFQFKVMRAS